MKKNHNLNRTVCLFYNFMLLLKWSNKCLDPALFLITSIGFINSKVGYHRSVVPPNYLYLFHIYNWGHNNSSLVSCFIPKVGNAALNWEIFFFHWNQRLKLVTEALTPADQLLNNLVLMLIFKIGNLSSTHTYL